jgi:cation:H+ antiporter
MVIESLTTIFVILISIALLSYGADILVKGASSLSLQLGISPLAIGLTVVAFGTSTPELVVSMSAALKGSGDIAVGNVIGSNICNIALILGLCALITPVAVQAKIFYIDIPFNLVVSIIVAIILLTTGIGMVQGVILVLALIAYTTFTLKYSKQENTTVVKEFSEAVAHKPEKISKSIIFVILGFIALIAGGNLLVNSAVSLAKTFGISEAIIGLTIVAVGTSLPELATSVVAALRGQGDIAIGNVVGSNIFNILGILGATAIVHPLNQGNITVFSIACMLILALLLIPMAITKNTVSRLEGILLLFIFCTYTILLVYMGVPI